MSKIAAFSVIVLFSLLLAVSGAAAAAAFGKVGGRTPISDVKNNKEIQQLGKYCVEEYNNRLHHRHHQKLTGSDSESVVFTQVVAAEKQVVSGIRYFLKISTTTASSGGPKMFDAVVVVKPWAPSKQLVKFSPSPSSPATIRMV